MQISTTFLPRCTNVSLRKTIKRSLSSYYPSHSRSSIVTAMNPQTSNGAERPTTILPVDATKLGNMILNKGSDFLLDDWEIELEENEHVRNVQLAAQQLRNTDIPIAFPTETVYGLGADATRSDAVRGIYKAKQRPSDNPLIVHFASLRQLRSLLRPSSPAPENGEVEDLVPAIYKPLIQKFWPGPLTIILSNPESSPLASEVTAGLSTFGARMPRDLLALLLIKLANVPIAAPSANASTKPSPTAAEHVKDDLDGRIDYILDGGPCDVGVESTVVDGLSNPPAVLRPGGISIEQLRTCSGWENVVVGYRDAAEANGAPRAPGMKYRHYSPAATVILHEVGSALPSWKDIARQGCACVGIVRTRYWKQACGLIDLGSFESFTSKRRNPPPKAPPDQIDITASSSDGTGMNSSFLDTLHTLAKPVPSASCIEAKNPLSRKATKLWDIELGPNTEDIARGLFSALRELDRKHVDVIYVEGIADEEGDVAAAVMNRLRKAAEVKVR